MITIPSIETKRLTLRAHLEGDLPSMNDYLFNDRMSFNGGLFDHLGTWHALLASLGHWRLRSFEFLHIEQCESEKMAGAMGFLHHFDWPKTELGWNLHNGFGGKVMAYEAAPAAWRYGETHLNISGVISFIDAANTRSAALAKRLGATFEKTDCLRKYDCHVYRHPTGHPTKKATQSETNQ